jgi:hypothetical protein
LHKEAALERVAKGLGGKIEILINKKTKIDSQYREIKQRN